MGLAEDLEGVRTDAETAFAAAPDAAALEAARVAFLGRSGRLKDLGDAFAALPGAEKRGLGPIYNRARQAVQAAFDAARARLARAADDAPIDLTVPAQARRLGSVHPIAQVSADVARVFESMGFELIDGPHIELDEFNFGRLNIPPDHPARDAQDTFWLDHPQGLVRLLRTHTSAVQSRTYPAVKPPLRRVVVGKVFRYEAVDATHDNNFNQVEGFVVDRGITARHLVGAIRTMIAAVLRRDDVEIRLRPHAFPFVEPGYEVDVRIPGAEGRLGRWMELLGCGMIHPGVLAQGGIDPGEWQGFAFGLGLERLTMVRHGIGDIRVFNGADLRALRQFGAG